MNPWKKKIQPAFNDAKNSTGAAHESYIITLTRPAADTAKQAQDFAQTLSRWLLLQGDGQSGNAKAPGALPAANTGNARVSIDCTEATMAKIERQFGSDILRVDPPAEHARGAIKPPKVDPWDVSKW